MHVVPSITVRMKGQPCAIVFSAMLGEERFQGIKQLEHCDTSTPGTSFRSYAASFFLVRRALIAPRFLLLMYMESGNDGERTTTSTLR